MDAGVKRLDIHLFDVLICRRHRRGAPYQVYSMMMMMTMMTNR